MRSARQVAVSEQLTQKVQVKRRCLTCWFHLITPSMPQNRRYLTVNCTSFVLCLIGWGMEEQSCLWRGYWCASLLSSRTFFDVIIRAREMIGTFLFQADSWPQWHLSECSPVFHYHEQKIASVIFKLIMFYLRRVSELGNLNKMAKTLHIGPVIADSYTLKFNCSRMIYGIGIKNLQN